MYSLLRPGLFALESERAHRITLAGLARGAALLQRFYAARTARAPVEIMGLALPNPIGLAAGLDKDGACIDGMAALGFGFLELGTVTPVAQPGNARPRLFRLVDERALVNRMGFNNAGADGLARRIAAADYRGVIGINIGRNAATPAEHAVDDYRAALRAVYTSASYITVNISSPNTPGLRGLQAGEALDELLMALVDERNARAAQHGRRVPLAVKIAPDVTPGDLATIADALIAHGIDGVVATNTTVDRGDVALRWRHEAGGLSGVPLRKRSTAVIAGLYERLGERIPIIGVGGIQSARDALDKLDAGARALQLYTGLIYRGPGLVNECARAAARWQARQRVMAQSQVIRGDRARAEADARIPDQ